MKRIRCFRMALFSLLLLNGSSNLQTAAAATQLDIFPFYRQDNRVWNKAGLGNFPNVLSELKWENLRTQGIKAVLKHDVGPRYFLETTGSYGYTYSGTTQDSDYDGDNRTQEYSRSNSNGNGGNMFDASLSLGRSCRIQKKRKSVCWRGPWVCVVHEQNLNKRLHLTTRPEYHLPPFYSKYC